MSVGHLIRTLSVPRKRKSNSFSYLSKCCQYSSAWKNAIIIVVIMHIITKKNKNYFIRTRDRTNSSIFYTCIIPWDIFNPQPHHQLVTVGKHHHPGEFRDSVESISLSLLLFLVQYAAKWYGKRGFVFQISADCGIYIGRNLQVYSPSCISCTLNSLWLSRLSVEL